MRWVFFAVMLLIAVVLQTTVVPLIAIQGIRPDLPALFAMHILLAAQPIDAMLGLALIGLAVDLNGLSFGEHANVGANVLAYGLVSLLGLKVRTLTFRDNAVTYFAFSLFGTALIQLLVKAYMLVRIQRIDDMQSWAVFAVATAAYTAFASPYAHWLLRRARGWLGIGPMRTLRAR